LIGRRSPGAAHPAVRPGGGRPSALHHADPPVPWLAHPGQQVQAVAFMFGSASNGRVSPRVPVRPNGQGDTHATARPGPKVISVTRPAAHPQGASVPGGAARRVSRSSYASRSQGPQYGGNGGGLWMLGAPPAVALGGNRRRLAGPYPGAELVPGGKRSATMAVTIEAPPGQLWPWLAQMGWDRGGWYSWDRLDNTYSPAVQADGRLGS